MSQSLCCRREPVRVATLRSRVSHMPTEKKLLMLR